MQLLIHGKVTAAANRKEEEQQKNGNSCLGEVAHTFEFSSSVSKVFLLPFFSKLMDIFLLCLSMWHPQLSLPFGERHKWRFWEFTNPLLSERIFSAPQKLPTKLSQTKDQSQLLSFLFCFLKGQYAY